MGWGWGCWSPWQDDPLQRCRQGRGRWDTQGGCGRAAVCTESGAGGGAQGRGHTQEGVCGVPGAHRPGGMGRGTELRGSGLGVAQGGCRGAVRCAWGRNAVSAQGVVCVGMLWGWHRGGSVCLPHTWGRGRGGGSGFPCCEQCPDSMCTGSVGCQRPPRARRPARSGPVGWQCPRRSVCAGTAPAAVRWWYLQRCLHEHGGHSACEMLSWPCFQMWAPLACSGQRGCCQHTGSELSAAQRALAACLGCLRGGAVAACSARCMCRQCAGRVHGAACPGNTQVGNTLPICSVGCVQVAYAECPGSVHGAVHWQCAQCSVCRQHPCCAHGAGSKLAAPWQCSVQHGQAVGQDTGRAVCAGSLGQCTGSVGAASCQCVGQRPGSVLCAACRQREGSTLAMRSTLAACRQWGQAEGQCPGRLLSAEQAGRHPHRGHGAGSREAAHRQAAAVPGQCGTHWQDTAQPARAACRQRPSSRQPSTGLSSSPGLLLLPAP